MTKTRIPKRTINVRSVGLAQDSFDYNDLTSETISAVEISPDDSLPTQILDMIHEHVSKYYYEPVGLILGPKEYLILNTTMWQHNIKCYNINQYAELTEFARLPIRVCPGATILLEVDPHRATMFIDEWSI